MENREKLKVMVHYVAAGEPFKDEQADPAETVGQLKLRVLREFGLAEGATPDGNMISYTLYHQETPLEDANRTLGDLAGDHRVLQLKLVQQLIQGR